MVQLSSSVRALNELGAAIALATVGALWTWAMILIAHMGYRRAVAEGRAQPSPFRMPGSPVTNWIALAFIVLVTCFLALDPNTRVALYVGPVWFGILAVGLPVDQVSRAGGSLREGYRSTVGQQRDGRRHHVHSHL